MQHLKQKIMGQFWVNAIILSLYYTAIPVKLIVAYEERPIRTILASWTIMAAWLLAGIFLSPWILIVMFALFLVVFGPLLVAIAFVTRDDIVRERALR
jgi:succinate-acetate transporter protein